MEVERGGVPVEVVGEGGGHVGFGHVDDVGLEEVIGMGEEEGGEEEEDTSGGGRGHGGRRSGRVVETSEVELSRSVRERIINEKD